jgi:hypothetical protein
VTIRATDLAFCDLCKDAIPTVPGYHISDVAILLTTNVIQFQNYGIVLAAIHTLLTAQKL